MRPVVIVCDFAEPNGGSAVLSLALARGLAERGVPVTYLSGDGPRDLGPIRHVALGGASLLETSRTRAMREGYWNRAAHDALVEVVREMPNAIFHVHSWAQILSPSVFDALKPVAQRTVVHVHDAFLTCPNGVPYLFGRDEVCWRDALSASCLATRCDKRSSLHKAWRSLRHARLRRSFDPALPWGALAMIHPGQTHRLLAEGHPAERLQVHRNPAAPWTSERLRAEDGDEILFAGRLEPGKGARALVRAAAEAGMTARIVGEGSLTPEIAAMPNAVMEGWLDGPGIARAATRARAAAMPSRFPEPFGLAAAEASRSGLPVVVSSRAYIAEDVETLGLGLSPDADDPAALPRALAAIRSMPDARIRAMSDAGHAGPGLGPSETDWVEGLMALYAELGARPA